MQKPPQAAAQLQSIGKNAPANVLNVIQIILKSTKYKIYRHNKIVKIGWLHGKCSNYN